MQQFLLCPCPPLCPVQTCPVVACPTATCPTSSVQTSEDQITRDRLELPNHELPQWVFVVIPVMATIIVLLFVVLCIVVRLGQLLPCNHGRSLLRTKNLVDQNKNQNPILDQSQNNSVVDVDDNCRIESIPEVIVVFKGPCNEPKYRTKVQPLDSDDDSD